MRALDDLIAAFSRGMPARVAEATELWLGFEQGSSESLAVLRRLLHTIKGEAHMLELGACAELAEVAESVVDSLRKTGEVTPLAGDALLGAFEAMGMVTALSGSEEEPDLTAVFSQLRAAIEDLGSTEAALEGRPMVRTIPPAARDSRQPSVSPERPSVDVLSAEDVRPLVHDLRRLYGEQAILHERLREAQRMLRALLIEIDPRQGVEGLAERVTKTLGYGLEFDRRVNTIRAEWSSNDFAVGLTLDELDNFVRRASVVSTDRLLNQVLRVGRSTGRTLNKGIDLEVHGDAILDATVAQRLEPALLHLVRNAIDHGIEAQSVRRERGKPERGQVKVTIGQTESSVTVEVSDDGGGVDFDRLRAVLASRVEGIDKLSADELIPYLFEQGVSTSEQVTKISGRGIGLDVVAREVAGAGGQTRIESKPGVGTKVLLHLPTTLRGELVVPIVTGRQRFALPTRSVYSVVRIQRIERTDDGIWIRLARGSSQELVRLFALGALLGYEDEPKVGEAALILYHAAGLFAVSVSGYEIPRAISLTRSQELPFDFPLIRGVAPTPDGGVMLLLDVEALHASARGASAAGTGHAQAAERRRQPRALVVEDAPVARELLCGILRSLGLKVEEATDGRQGLMLAREDPPDVVLTDIEMPYMDGIEMITHFRNSTVLSRVPVIVLTTAANESNRAKLDPLGVAGLLSKQKFVEKELRQLIERCLKLTT